MQYHTFRKILTPIVLTQQNSTLTAWAECLSNLFKAQLILYNALGPTDTETNLGKPASSKTNKFFKSSMIRLMRIGSQLQNAYSVKYFIEDGKHWRNLTKQLREEYADLLITEMPRFGKPSSGALIALMYNSPCPILCVREDMVPAISGKILVPVRLKDGLEQKLPAVIAWAKAHSAMVHLSIFAETGAPAREKTKLFYLGEKMALALREANVKVEIETAHGFHFGTSMIARAAQVQADLIAIGIEPVNFISWPFSKIIAPFFLENSHVPILAIPLLKQGIEQKSAEFLVPPLPVPVPAQA